MPSSKAVVHCVAVAFCLLIVLSEFAKAAPSINDLENIKELYEMLLSERFGHQLVRKAGRDPAVRLRFGRRTDPYLQLYPSSESAENMTN